MKLKKIGLGLATATAVIGGMALTEAPAQAANLTGTLDIDLQNKVNSISYTSSTVGTVDFDNNPFSTSSNSTGSFVGQAVKLKDLNVPLPGGSLNSFISFVGGSLDGYTFDLQQLINPHFETIGSINSFSAELKGIFNPTGQAGSSSVDSLIAFRVSTGTNGGDINITPVPTPALLPGLLGMGVAALRKRKSQGEADETVPVEANT